MRAVLRGPLGRKAGLGDGAGAGGVACLARSSLFTCAKVVRKGAISCLICAKVLLRIEKSLFICATHFFLRVTGGDVEVGLLSRLTVDFHGMFARWCEERGRNRQAVLSGGVVADQ